MIPLEVTERTVDEMIDQVKLLREAARVHGRREVIYAVSRFTEEALEQHWDYYTVLKQLAARLSQLADNPDEGRLG